MHMETTLKKLNNKQNVTLIQPSIKNAYHKKNQTDLVQYLHSSALVLSKSTWINDIQKDCLQS